jgi:hypothetical protein
MTNNFYLARFLFIVNSNLHSATIPTDVERKQALIKSSAHGNLPIWGVEKIVEYENCVCTTFGILIRQDYCSLSIHFR